MFSATVFERGLLGSLVEFEVLKVKNEFDINCLNNLDFNKNYSWLIDRLDSLCVSEPKQP